MKIICLGDSLTAGHNVRHEYCWVSLLQQETEDTWINAGISGDTSVGMLVRLHSEVLPQRPDEVLLMGGDNDILLTGSTDVAKASIMAIVHQCVNARVKPIIGIPFALQAFPGMWADVCSCEAARMASQQYLQWLRSLVRTLLLRHVDFDEAFHRAGNRSDLYQADGLHPTVTGHRIMADTVKTNGLFSY